MPVRSSMIWNTLSSRVASRPATTRISIRPSQPAIHNAALGLEGVRYIEENARAYRADAAQGSGRPPVSATASGFATGKSADAVLHRVEFRYGSGRPIGAKGFGLSFRGASETNEPGIL